MYEFLERFIKSSASPYSRFSRSFAALFRQPRQLHPGDVGPVDFPEVELDKIKRNIGFDVTIVTTARTNAEAKSLLSEMGMPFSDRARSPSDFVRRTCAAHLNFMSTVTDPIADFMASCATERGARSRDVRALLEDQSGDHSYFEGGRIHHRLRR
jgi:hypothetical protein